MRPRRLGVWGVQLVLLAYTVLALGPIILIIANSMKSRRAIFDSAFSLPWGDTFDLVGYETVFERANFGGYFLNSLIVTVVSVVLVVWLSAMAAHALVEYRFRGNTLLGLYMAFGIMIPIRLGTVSLLELMVRLNLVNTLWALILVYTAMGIPLGVFLLSQFLRQSRRSQGPPQPMAPTITGLRPRRPADPPAARRRHVQMLPVWNDLWFPLILAPAESKRTVTLGAQQFLGQFASDWNAVLAALTLAIVPIVVLYIIFSRQFLGGLTEGAIK